MFSVQGQVWCGGLILEAYRVTCTHHKPWPVACVHPCSHSLLSEHLPSPRTVSCLMQSQMHFPHAQWLLTGSCSKCPVTRAA